MKKTSNRITIVFCALLTSLCIVMNGPEAVAQPDNSEIFLFSIEKQKTGVKMTGGANVSQKPGYDNQPSFSADSKSILFTSDRDEGSTNIFEYHIDSGQTERIIKSDESEYTPRDPDGKTVYFVREGSGQEMTVWKYDRKSEVESWAFEVKEPIAYYDWNSKGAALVWVRYAAMARYIDPVSNLNLFVEEHVLPSTPHNIPGTSNFSFLHRQGDDQLWIKEFDPETRAIRPIIKPKDNSVDYCWLPDGTILTGSGNKIYGFHELRDKDWVELADLSEFGLKDITRMDTSPNGNWLVVVSNQ